MNIAFTRKTAFSLLFIVACLGVVWGQADKKEKTLTHYSMQHWTTEKGLPSSQLLDITQTPDGYLWMASYLGMIRFDGFSFTVYSEENTAAFENNSFTGVHVARDSTLWVYSPNVGLYAYKEGTFKRYADTLSAVSLENHELPSSIMSLRFGYEPFTYFHNTIRFTEIDTVLHSIQLNHALQGLQNEIYLGTSKGLYIVDGNELKHFFKLDGLRNDFINSLLVNDDGMLWLGTQSGLFYFDGEKFEEEPLCRGLDIKEMLRDDDDYVWIGTKSGLYRLSPSKDALERLSTENGLSHNHIPIIFQDSEENIWILPLKGGLTRLKDNKFVVYNNAIGLDAEVINTVCEISPGVYLIGSDRGTIHRLEENKLSQFNTKYPLAGNRIRHIYQDSKENLWISTYGGLLKISPKGDEKWFSTETGFPTSLCRLVYEDSRGVIWIGTRDVGIIQLLPDGEYQIINRNNGLGANLIMSFEESGDGRMLVGTSGAGLNILKDDVVIESYDTDDGLTGSVVFNTYTDDDGVIWVACNSGLSRLENGRITPYDLEHGVDLDSPYDVINDHLGNFWIPSPAGLIRVKKSDLNEFAEGEITELEMKVFDKYDGIPFEGINPVAQSLRSENDLIWIPTLNGLLSVDPDDIILNETPPPVHIEGMFSESDTFNLNTGIVIPATAQRIVLKYTAICLQAPEKVKFRYILEGYDEDWVNVGSDIRTVSYTNLPAGDYVFRVIASNNDGVWNEVGDKVAFTVKPYWYETWAIRIGALLLLLLLTYLIYRVRINQLNRQKAALERIVLDRTTEIREQKNKLEDLNATKDKFFNIIAHDLRNPFNSIRGLTTLLREKLSDHKDDDLKKFLDALHHSGEEAYKLLENLLGWARAQTGRIEFDPEHFDLSDAINEVLELKSNIGTEKEIEILYDGEDELRVFADRNMFFAIMRNLISNAIKFSHRSSTVRIGAEEREHDFLVYVQDKGIGMRPEIAENIFKISEKTTTPGTEDEQGTGLGLLICKEFITAHNGRIWVETEKDVGSTFYFTLPKQSSE